VFATANESAKAATLLERGGFLLILHTGEMQAMNDNVETETPSSSPNQCSDSAFTSAFIIRIGGNQTNQQSEERFLRAQAGEADQGA
jgi:hypothetical protein